MPSCSVTRARRNCGSHDKLNEFESLLGIYRQTFEMCHYFTLFDTSIQYLIDSTALFIANSYRKFNRNLWHARVWPLSVFFMKQIIIRDRVAKVGGKVWNLIISDQLFRHLLLYTFVSISELFTHTKRWGLVRGYCTYMCYESRAHWLADWTRDFSVF